MRVLLFGSGLLALALAGCTTDGGSGPLASAGGRSIAFETIDGPPQAAFETLVSALDREAQRQAVPVVSREASAAYRVRGYLSTHVERGKTSVAYVFDVYDAQSQRALRISGTEPVERTRKGWDGADERLMGKIAERGVARLAAFVQAPGVPATPEPEAAPAPAGSMALALAAEN